MVELLERPLNCSGLGALGPHGTSRLESRFELLDLITWIQGRKRRERRRRGRGRRRMRRRVRVFSRA